MLKVDLACGTDKKEGFIGIDIRDYGQKYIRDIRERLPFENETVDEIHIWHILEHFQWEEVKRILYECHRVLKRGSRINIQVPDGTDPTQFRPYHVALYSLDSLNFINDKKGEWYDKFTLIKKERGKYGHLTFIIKKL
jgi:predicted SAM-dependent methyltransferase